MKLIKPSVEYIPQSEGLDGMYKHIELCSRICYKSEDRITEDSAKKMIDGLIKAGHGAMLEHGTVYLYLEVTPFNAFSHFEYPLAKFTAPYNWSDVVGSIAAKYRSNPYSKVTTSNDSRNYRKVYITTNFRVLVENGWLDDLQFISKSVYYHPKRYTLKFTCARIDSQSITRYRHNSYAQESQRVVNYMMERYGMSVTFSQPIWVKPEDLEELKQDAAISEQLYFKWIKKGYKPEEARYFLINGTKTEIMVTAYENDWRHFFDERLRHTTGRPSSDMHHLAQLAWNEFKSKLNLEL
jgi:thymidylate synthase (FAD)